MTRITRNSAPTLEQTTEAMDQLQGRILMTYLGLAIGLILLGSSVALVLRAHARAAWELYRTSEKTMGKARMNESYKRRAKGVTSYSIMYSFTVDGKEYANTQAISFPPADNGEIPVYYLKDRPTVNALDVGSYLHGINLNAYLMAGLGILISFYNGVQLLIRRSAFNRHRRHQAALQAAGHSSPS